MSDTSNHRSKHMAFVQMMSDRLHESGLQINSENMALKEQCHELKQRISNLETQCKVKDQLLHEKSKDIVLKITENIKLKEENDRLRQKLQSLQQVQTSKPSITETDLSQYSTYSTSPSLSEPEPQQISSTQQLQQIAKSSQISSSSMRQRQRIRTLQSKRRIMKPLPIKPLPPNNKLNQSINDNINKSNNNNKNVNNINVSNNKSMKKFSIRLDSLKEAKSNDTDDDKDNKNKQDVNSNVNQSETDQAVPFIHRKTNTQLSTLSAQAVNEPLPALSPISESESRDIMDEDTLKRKQVIAFKIEDSNDNAAIYQNEWNQSIADSDDTDDNQSETVSMATFQSNDTNFMGESEGKETIKPFDLESTTTVDTERLMELNMDLRRSSSRFSAAFLEFNPDQSELSLTAPPICDEYNDDSEEHEQTVMSSDTASVMTDNKYLLMDMTKSQYSKHSKQGSDDTVSIGNFSQRSNGNESNCDVVIKAPFNFSFNQQTTFHLVVNNNNDDDDDEKASMVSSLTDKKVNSDNIIT